MARLFWSKLFVRRLSDSKTPSTCVNVHKHKLTRPTRKKFDSLIPQTLREMEAVSTSSPSSITDEADDDFRRFVGQELRRRRTRTLQVNIGLYCNQACSHCHVESSPKRIKDVMSETVAEKIIELVAASKGIRVVDITGGAPELCPQFRPLISGLRKSAYSDLEIVDRCNLTSLLEPGQETTVDFLASKRIHVIASLPCYEAKNVNLQRGSKVFQRSIEAIRELNRAGFGIEGSGLALDFVYNPLGGFLPPPQKALEEKYKEELRAAFGIEFNELFVVTNMPIKRFNDFLRRRGELEHYRKLLRDNFNPKTLDGLMCKEALSVAYDGRIFNCDFNAQLDGMEIAESILDVDDIDEAFLGDAIATGNHCFGCTAASGSS